MLFMMPIASEHLAFERPARADGHGKNITRLGDGLKRDLFAESDVTVRDRFQGLLPLAADAQRRNSEAYFDCLGHLIDKENGTPAAFLYYPANRLLDFLR
jgi:hypothetical protein